MITQEMRDFKEILEDLARFRPLGPGNPYIFHKAGLQMYTYTRNERICSVAKTARHAAAATATRLLSRKAKIAAAATPASALTTLSVA